MANETNQGQQSGQAQQGQKQNPSTQQPEQKKSNQAGDQGTDQARQAPGRDQEQGNQPMQRRDPATEQGDITNLRGSPPCRRGLLFRFRQGENIWRMKDCGNFT